MRISLLARDDQAPTTTLLRKSAHRLGLELRLFEIEKLSFQNTPSGIRILHQNEEVLFTRNEWLWPRLGSLTREQGLTCVQAFEVAGFRCVNPSAAIRISSDKIESHLFLLKHGFPVPRSWIFFPWTKWTEKDLEGPSRFWIKNRVGSQGIGVSWADSKLQALAQVDLIRMNQGAGLLQEHLDGDEIRVLVWQNEILGAVRKQKVRENPRGNAHQGTKSEVFSLNSEQKNLCLQATTAFRLNLSGLDLIVSKNQVNTILEVNPSPGFSDLTEVCGQDFASKFLEDLAKS